MRFCLHSKNEVSVSYIFLECKCHWLSNSNFLKICFHNCKIPGMGSSIWGTQTPSSVRTSALMISPLFVRLTWECESWLYRISTSSYLWLFISLSWKCFPLACKVIFIDSFPVCTCNLVCRLKEVSSGSSYSALWILSFISFLASCTSQDLQYSVD